MKLRRKKRIEEVVELNITAFMDLMVSLVCFLLITAVFSRMSVVELNLPQLNAKAKPDQEIKLSLQLVVHSNSFDIRDENLGSIKQIERNPEKTDWKLFDKTLLEIKYRFPEEQNISLLLEPGISYKTMIEVMDHVRTTNVVNAGTVEEVELFPNISVGDAPEVAAIEPVATGLVEPEGQTSVEEKK
ncbi:MAG: biopolymer transporter ExbD [Gammaproteobacteria bacterium]|nr:MAG: biopolymer transporter ExbD [Gammaproteobacteria bacterium]